MGPRLQTLDTKIALLWQANVGTLTGRTRIVLCSILLHILLGKRWTSCPHHGLAAEIRPSTNLCPFFIGNSLWHTGMVQRQLCALLRKHWQLHDDGFQHVPKTSSLVPNTGNCQTRCVIVSPSCTRTHSARFVTASSVASVTSLLSEPAWVAECFAVSMWRVCFARQPLLPYCIIRRTKKSFLGFALNSTVSIPTFALTAQPTSSSRGTLAPHRLGTLRSPGTSLMSQETKKDIHQRTRCKSTPKSDRLHAIRSADAELKTSHQVEISGLIMVSSIQDDASVMILYLVHD